MANYLARATYGSEAFAVDCLQYPCWIGCKYIDNVFYNPDGITPIKHMPTQEAEVDMLKTENTNLELVLAEQYETNLLLQEELTNTQLALTKLYEGLEG